MYDFNMYSHDNFSSPWNDGTVINQGKNILQGVGGRAYPDDKLRNGRQLPG